MRHRALFVALVGTCVASSCSSRERVSSPPPEAAWPEAAWTRAGVATSGARTSTLARIPSRSVDVVRVDAAPGKWLEQRALDLRDVAAVEEPGRARFPRAAASLDLLRFATRDGFEEVRVLREAGVHRARYRVRLGEGLARLRLREGTIEALDASGTAWLRSPKPFAVDAHGVRRDADVALAREGDDWRIDVTLDGKDLAAPIALDPGWFVTTAMSTPRANFAMVQLGSGKYLVTGGDLDRTYATALSTTEIWDPATKTWTSGPSMIGKRARHGAVVLADGKVLVAGGGECFYCSGVSSPTLLSTAEIYDGTTWTAAAAMSTPRAGAGYIRTPSNTVLAAGGGTSGTLVSKSAEYYDPVANKWTATTNYMTDFRVWPSTAIRAGKVLVFGGFTYYNALSSADSYDSTTNTFAAITPMTVGRVFASVGVLDDGTVIAVGGSKDVNSNSTSAAALTTADVLSPSTGVWTSIAGPKVAHSGAASLVLPGGKMLVAGGFGTTQKPVSEVDMYDRVAGTWTPYGSLSFAHSFGGLANAGTTDFVVFGGVLGDYDYTKSYTATATAEITGTALTSSTKCTNDGNCTSGFCVDGRCCNAACTGQCEACDVPGSEGNCVPVNGAPHGGRTPCGGSPECAKTCDGVSTACTQGKVTTSCGGPHCTGNTLSPGGTCSGDASNACNMTAGTPCSGDLLCDTPTACKTSCLSNLDCVTGKVCDIPSGTCGAPKPDAGPDAEMEAATDTGTVEDTAVGDSGEIFDGAKPGIPDKPLVSGSFQRCVHDADCPTHHCVEGICCDTACTDRCHSCALLSAPGVCTLEPAGVDLKNECGAENTCTGTCGSAGECIGAGAGSMCARNQCNGPSSGIGPAYCSGPGAACSNADVVPFDCSPYACAPAFGACLTGCATSDDCANGFVCDVG
ncbi:MAG: hypothetical protein ACXVEF_43715, partial [Polyangiales bacterium]